MFGTLMTNLLIERRIRDGSLRIEPFDLKRLQVCQYRLTPKEILFENVSEGKLQRTSRHNLEDGDYSFKPSEYAIVTVREHVVLPDGVVGRFVPESGLIESGFILTAGKLDPGYGRNGEQIRFGLHNARAREASFLPNSPLAHLQLFDISGLPSTESGLSHYDRLIRRLRLEKNLPQASEDLDEGLRELERGDSQKLWE